VGPWYSTREEVMNATDIKSSARMNRQIDRALEAASRAVEQQLHRKFYPVVATRYFPWPERNMPTPWRIWLEEDEMVSLMSLTSGGITISPSEVLLEPANTGPPFTRLELNIGTSSAFDGGATHQRAIAITGVFGYNADEESADELAADAAISANTITITNASIIGIGDLIRIGDERLLVTSRSSATTGQTTTAIVDNGSATVLVPVSDGSIFNVDETITLDTERMTIVDVFGNNLMVRRAVDGSVLGAHPSGTTIYAQRALQVTRGAYGTYPATHLASTEIMRNQAPEPVRSFVLAAAISQVLQETSGYGRTVGSGDNEREASGRGVRAMREALYQQYGRKRIGAV